MGWPQAVWGKINLHARNSQCKGPKEVRGQWGWGAVKSGRAAGDEVPDVSRPYNVGPHRRFCFCRIKGRAFGKCLRSFVLKLCVEMTEGGKSRSRRGVLRSRPGSSHRGGKCGWILHVVCRETQKDLLTEEKKTEGLGLSTLEGQRRHHHEGDECKWSRLELSL